MKKLLCLALFVFACGPTPEPRQTETWEQFEARSKRVANGQTLYVVDRDILVSHEDLRAYYEANIAASASPDGLGKAEQPLIVNQVGGQDDIWNMDRRRNLTYCVSDEFENLKGRALSEMWAATAAWEGAANVQFVYDPTQDGNCRFVVEDRSTHNNVVIRLRPWTSVGAAANLPHSFPRTSIWINIPNIDTWGGDRSVAVLTHEVGHALGFHHEHNRTENTSTCTKETGTWRDLTAYDSGSVMHYPHCNGIAGAWSRAYALTDRDRQGAANLYGAGATPAGQNAIDRSEFFVRQVYRDVLGREPDPGGLVNAINWLQSCNGEPTCLAGARLDFARSVFESQEHRSRHPELNPSSPTYKADYLTRLYTAFLRRQPDTAGYNWWLNALNASGDYRGTVNGFITASEFRLRFGRQ